MATSTPSKRNAAVIADTVTTTGNVVIGGDLTVSGTTTTINTETINLADNIIVLNSNASGAATENAGIEIERGTDTNVSLIWDEGNNRWTVGSSNFVAGTFIGALSGNASTASSAAKWTTARTLSLTGAVTGSVSIDGSGNVSLATTATSDPTLTLSGDVTGSATFTNLGNATLTATVANDSHTHAFNNLTSKDGGTGDYITTGDFIAYSFRSPQTEYDWTAAPRANQDPMSIKLYDVYTDRASGPTGSYGSLLSVYGRSGHSEAQLFFGNNSDLYFREAFYAETSYNAWQQIFTNNYHPNADKWTTARTLSLTGDVTGSVSWDGSANASITTTVVNDSHNHDHSDGSFTVNGQLFVDHLRCRTGQDLTITAGESVTHLTESTYNDEYIRLAAENGIIVYASSDNLTSGLNRSTTLIDTSGNMTVNEGIYAPRLYTDIIYDKADTSMYISMDGDGGGAKVQTASGYLQLGSLNTSHCHFQTDRSNFYFNTEIRVDSGLIGSYNEDLYLRRASNASYQIQIAAGTTTISQNTVVQGTLTANSVNVSDGFGTLYTFNESLTLTTGWQDTSIAGADLATGSYVVQVSLNDYAVGGGQYSETYTGYMSWIATGTNDTSWDEIALHSAGHADNDQAIYLRTLRRASSTLVLQIAGETNNTAASTYTFKFRRMI